MNVIPLMKSNNTVQKENYWNSVFLYYSSPHLVNRRVLSVSQLYILKIFFKHDVHSIKNILNYPILETETRNLKCIESSCINESFIIKLFDQYVDNVSYELSNIEAVKDSIEDLFISVRILFPRNTKSDKCLEIVILDKENCSTTFLPICCNKKNAICPVFPYEIILNNKNFFEICVLNKENFKDKASEWLANTLFQKLMTWTEIKEFNTPIKKSLTLVSTEKYCNLYQELKLKYGDSIVKNWPENTDPLKFVYEDVAIATYLLLLWEKTSKLKQKFVDLGCGNGLLVHILTREGHDGYGIDIRSRKIWSYFGENTKLKVETIVPSSNYTFPDTNWILGNHSDELTPWIPVIAARSSRTCNYFLLPCCCYEFNGRKYQRKNSSQSQYQEYLDYVKQISDICGFKTEIDRLRIPSTKRICFIGVERESHETDEQITNLINNRCGTNSDNNQCWVENFEARPSTEKVRNCTKLDKTLISNIVKKIVNHLLINENFIEISSERRWNKGSSVHLSELVTVISQDELKQLKNECGGLQTLLKNHHYVFLVKNGTVQLRIPNNGNINKKFYKKTQCWFYLNHPDGCLLDANNCTYLH